VEYLNYSEEVGNALKNHFPIVALESTVITHGLPTPKNLEVARALEESIRSLGVVPATIGILTGDIHIGLTEDQLKALAFSKNVAKVSRRDIAGTMIKIFSKSENLINNAIIAANISSTTMILVGVLHFGEEEDSFFAMIQFIANAYQIYYNFDERIKGFLMLCKTPFCEHL